ncbi:hypothetical protein BKA62DRAFT_749172 [Auriculariales sp. MPI-PUGE-AT-0066]|nr:hypothetical protein BKA62DRAFT_749172 [Auriculariales sp. MPI-PUGE-AT-0066]
MSTRTNFTATAAHYDSLESHEADRLRLHPMERALTLDTIATHIGLSDVTAESDFSTPEHIKVADIGGATGVHAFALLDLAASRKVQAEIHLRDLAPKLVQRAQSEQDRRQAADPSLPTLASLGVGSALDPSVFPNEARETFDALTLDLLKPKDSGGPRPVLFAAFISRAAHLRDIAVRNPARLAQVDEAAFYTQYLTDGRYLKLGPTANDYRSSHHVGTPAEVHQLVEEAGGKVVELLGVEGILGGGLDSKLVDADEDILQAWVRVMRGLARDERNLGAADHWLAVIEKA